MELRPTPEQDQLVEVYTALYSKHCSPEAVMAAEPGGHSRQLWSRIREVGAVEMAVGTADERARLRDLALVAAQHGRFLAPTPMIEAQVAARLLAAVGNADADAALSAMLAGEQLVTIAVRPAAGGAAALVPAGAVADYAIVLDGDTLRLTPLRESACTVSNTGCLPLADVTLDGTAKAIADGRSAFRAFAGAVDECRVLTAAALQGLAARALEIVVGYVCERRAFGRQIGAFQGISHRLADRAAEVDGCELLVREAAWASECDLSRAPELAAMALGFAAETARDTTYFAVHFHGGYGFMLEYPIQAYFRRARTWSAILENPTSSYQLVADRRAARVALEGS